MRLWSPIQKFPKKFFFHKLSFFFKIFLDTHLKKTSVGQMIACYKQNIHLLPFADVFLKSLFVFAGAGGGDSSIGHYGGGGGGGGRRDCSIDPGGLYEMVLIKFWRPYANFAV